MDAVSKGSKRPSFRDPEDLWGAAEPIAERNGETVSAVVRDLLAGYIDVNSDPVYMEAIAIAAERGEQLEPILYAAIVEYVQRNT